MKNLIITINCIFLIISTYSQSNLEREISYNIQVQRDIEEQNNRESAPEIHISNDNIMKLPEPKYVSNTSVEKAIVERRSIRMYNDDPLSLHEVSQLLWAAQGITDSRGGYRTAPSAGALYPLEVYIVISNVEGLTQGVYKYKPHQHELVKVRDGNIKDELAAAALGQDCIERGAVAIIFSAVYERTTQKYGERGIRYVHIETGHAAQNIYLQAVSLNLGMVVVGAFKDAEVKKVLSMLDEEHPLYILPVGKR